MNLSVTGNVTNQGPRRMRRPVTIVDVARESGFSINTVSRALNNMPGVSAETKAHVVAVAERLRYTPSRVARSLLAQSTKTLGLVVTDCTSPVYSRIIRAVEDVASARGYSVILCNTGEEHEREVRAIRLLVESRVDGILITPVQLASDHIAELATRKVPIVLIGRRFENVDTCYVISDYASGAYLATRHLLSLGHRRIGHVTGREPIFPVRERLAAYRRALEDAGIAFEDSLVVRAARTIEGGCEGGHKLLSLAPRPSAIFAYNDVQAVGVMLAAREREIRVPQDLAVVGYDNVELFAYLEVPLTTVAQPSYEVGRIATEMLFRLIQDPDSVNERGVILAQQLVVRASCGARLGQVSRD